MSHKNNPKKDNSHLEMDDAFSALFEDALKAVESVDQESSPTPTAVQHSQSSSTNTDTTRNLDELDVDFEIEIEDIDAVSEMEFDQKPQTSQHNEELLRIQEEMAALEKQYAQLRLQYKEQKEINDRSQQRLASAHTHMQTMKEQRDQFQKRNQTLQNELENSAQRIRMLEGTIERQKQQIDKNGEMRRKEKQEMQKYGASSTLKQLLPALDSLDLAVANSEANPEVLKDGLRLLQTQFMDALSGAGVVRVPAAKGLPFNPAVHEAVMRVPSNEVQANHIVEAFCGAYRLHDRLLRAAMVSVATPKS